MDLRDHANILKQTVKEFIDDDCPRMAAALAYYTIFALPPMLVLIIMLAGTLLSVQQVESWIQGQVGGLIGADAADQIQTMVAHAQQRVEGGVSLGVIISVVGLLFGATGAFAQLQTALNAAWEVQPDPEQGGLKNFLLKRVFSLGMVLVIALLLLVSLLLSSIISTFSEQLGSFLPGGVSTALVWGINLALSLFLFTLLFGSIFKVLPDAKIAWRHVWIGGFATALLFEIGKFLISLYIGQSNPGEAYGAAAALALILVWVYYSSMIIFLGAEFTQVWTRRRGTGIQPAKGAIKIDTKSKSKSAPAPSKDPADT